MLDIYKGQFVDFKIQFDHFHNYPGTWKTASGLVCTFEKLVLYQSFEIGLQSVRRQKFI